MLRKILAENYEIDGAQMVQHIYQSLQTIQQQLEAEIANKQLLIEEYQYEIQALHVKLDQRTAAVETLQTRISECNSKSEGNRQLINKLLNDLERSQQSVDWYRRTYETRSLLGVIKDKLKHIIS